MKRHFVYAAGPLAVTAALAWSGPHTAAAMHATYVVWVVAACESEWSFCRGRFGVDLSSRRP